MEATRLADWLKDSKDDYEKTWSVVDSELYDLCGRKRHDLLRDVYTKVAIINRVYMAGISRSVAAGVDSDAELRVSRVLADCSDEVSSRLGELERIDDLSRTSMRTIVAAHGSLTKRLGEGLGARSLSSFVSKYLHFHCPIVPIYDSRVVESIGRVLANRVPAHTRTDQLLERPPVFDANYYWYAGRFLVIWQLANEAVPEMTVKLLDHALWRGVGEEIL
jgi:hypothetical protein